MVITKGHIPYSILNLPNKTIYTQVDATVQDVEEKIRDLAKNRAKFYVEWRNNKSIIIVWRKNNDLYYGKEL